MLSKAALVALQVVVYVTSAAGRDTWSDAANVCWNSKLERYVYQALDTYGCPEDAQALETDAACEAAAHSFVVKYEGKQRDSGAPTGCFYLTDEGGAVRAVVWNTINTPDDVYADAASLCFHPASQQYVHAALNSYGCPAGAERVLNTTACSAAAAFFNLSFQGSRRSGGLPSGCWYLADGAVAGKLTEAGWNTLGQAPPNLAPRPGSLPATRRLQKLLRSSRSGQVPGSDSMKASARETQEKIAVPENRDVINKRLSLLLMVSTSVATCGFVAYIVVLRASRRPQTNHVFLQVEV